MAVLKVDGNNVQFKMIEIFREGRKSHVAQPESIIGPGQHVHYCISDYGLYYFRYFTAMREMDYVR